MSQPSEYDVLIIGGGPAGATAGYLLGNAGIRACIVEKTPHPRFHIGESLLPRNAPLLAELGLEKIMDSVPHTQKLGAEFCNGDGFSTSFGFEQGLIPGSPTFNVERAPFDEALLGTAKAAGTEVREGIAVKEILKLEDGDVRVMTDDGNELRGKYLFDASGQNTVVPRHLGTRKSYAGREFQKVAYFAHFENVVRRSGREGGNPCIVMCEEGWFWLIPIDERRTSIGLVMDAVLAKQTGMAANKMLAWGMARCPAIIQRTANATGPDTNDVIANFSYSCRPFAGPGFFLLGDAATFLDPIFSSGVLLGMMSAREAATLVEMLFKKQIGHAAARKRYGRFIDNGTGTFFRLISQYYRHSFRELFLNGAGPVRVHNAVLSVLAGQIFPRLPWCLRWRLWFFAIFLHVNRFVPLVPRRPKFSLMTYEPSMPAEVATA
jgi:flavin-dependent dehydrogenase